MLVTSSIARTWLRRLATLAHPISGVRSLWPEAPSPVLRPTAKSSCKPRSASSGGFCPLGCPFSDLPILFLHSFNKRHWLHKSSCAFVRIMEISQMKKISLVILMFTLLLCAFADEKKKEEKD